MIIFKLTATKFFKNSISLFCKFYLLFVTIAILTNGPNAFSYFFPFVIFIAFLFTTKVLLKIQSVDIDGVKFLEITYLQFFFFKSKISAPQKVVMFTYKEEKTSRLVSSDVLTIYFDNIEVFKRYHPLDGVCQQDTFEIIEFFHKINIKQID